LLGGRPGFKVLNKPETAYGPDSKWLGSAEVKKIEREKVLTPCVTFTTLTVLLINPNRVFDCRCKWFS